MDTTNPVSQFADIIEAVRAGGFRPSGQTSVLGDALCWVTRGNPGETPYQQQDWTEAYMRFLMLGLEARDFAEKNAAPRAKERYMKNLNLRSCTSHRTMNSRAGREIPRFS